MSWVVLRSLASMRPRHKAAENVTRGVRKIGFDFVRFNEAAA